MPDPNIEYAPRKFRICLEVSTTASQDQIMTAARKTYEGHGYEPGEEPIPGLTWAVVDLIADTLNFDGTLFSLGNIEPFEAPKGRQIGGESA